MIKIFDFNSGEDNQYYSGGRDLEGVEKVDQCMISCVGRKFLDP
jgi:hypothetical protein